MNGHPIWRQFRCLLTGLFLARGICLLCILPPLEGWDEYQHIAYVAHVHETGRIPILGQTSVPASLRRALAGLPRSSTGTDGLGEIGVNGYREYWQTGARLGPKATS